MYTEEEFVLFYGTQKGPAMWKNAGVEEPGTTSVSMPSNEPTETTAVSQNKNVLECKRRAPKGYMYTVDEFVSFYGHSKGIATWESAGVEEPVTASVPMPPKEPTAGTHACDQEPGTESTAAPQQKVRVVVSPNDIQRLRADAKRIHGNFGNLHAAARAELNRWINIGAGAGEPGSVAFPWQHYVAMQSKAKALVGPGITAFLPAFIADTNDSNKASVPHLDFIIRHTDGGHWRIHPGSKPRFDARPKYFAASGDTMQEIGHQGRLPYAADVSHT